jgi:nitrate/TMAO reductase-like tetraheme cytochrome c subunit
MVVYASGNHGAVPIVGAGTYQTYFFVAAPYNAGAPYDKSHAPSTDQFCRQCHWPQANEAYGATTIGTAF